MRAIWLGLSLALMLGAAARATTYTYAGHPLANVLNHSTCTISPCADYSATDTVTGTFTTATPLPPNLSGTDISPALTSYSFTDGHNTISSADPKSRIYAFTVDTDASGNVLDPFIILQLWYTATPASGSADINERQDFIQVTSFGDEAVTNGSCESGLASGPAATSPPDTCNGAAQATGDTSAAQTNPFDAGTFTTVPDPVPTLSEWAMGLAALMLAALGAYLARGRFRPA
jgi:hypothetical protein